MQKLRLRLTDLTIRSLPHTPATRYIWDADLRGFGLRIGKQSKTFVAIKHGGRRFSLGKYPQVGLKTARDRAKAALYGNNTFSLPATGPSTDEAFEIYLKTRHAKNKARTANEANRVFHKHFPPELRYRSVTAITTHELTAITDGLMHVPSTAVHVHSALKTFFNWCVERRYIEHSPLAGIASIIPPPVAPTRKSSSTSRRQPSHCAL